MSARKIAWDMCKALDPVAPPRVHDARRCESPGCTAWASFGFRRPGWEGLRERGAAFCGAHRDIGEVRL